MTYISLPLFLFFWLSYYKTIYTTKSYYVLYLLSIIMKTVAIIIVILLLARVGWSYFGTRSVEKPQITSTTALSGGVSLVEVAPMIQASVVVTWSQSEAIQNGFRQLAGYIFGDNTAKQPVAMTAPVAVEKTNTTIAMTAPVATQQQWDSYRVSFMMPSEYTLDTLPAPTDDTISFTELPSKDYYVRKFAGYAYESRAQKQLARFLTALDAQGIVVSAEPILNQYNDPWTMPLMRQNEWWIEKE